MDPLLTYSAQEILYLAPSCRYITSVICKYFILSPFLPTLSLLFQGMHVLTNACTYYLVLRNFVLLNFTHEICYFDTQERFNLSRWINWTSIYTKELMESFHFFICSFNHFSNLHGRHIRGVVLSFLFKSNNSASFVGIFVLADMCGQFFPDGRTNFPLYFLGQCNVWFNELYCGASSLSNFQVSFTVPWNGGYNGSMNPGPVDTRYCTSRDALHTARESSCALRAWLPAHPSLLTI